MPNHQQRRRGVFIIEAATSLLLIGVTLAAVSALIVSYRRAEEAFVTQRRLQLAAEGQMEQYRAGQPLPDKSIDLDGPGGISLRVECAAGQGQWAGLIQVSVTASTDARNRKHLSYRLTGYMAPTGGVSKTSAPKPVREATMS